MLQTIIKYPDIKSNLHFSGSLLIWLQENHPEYLEQVVSLYRQKQIEIIGGGFYEPILAIIPDRDKEKQIQLMIDWWYENYSVKPKGLWLAERVWEPDLADTFVEAGLEYTIVDDYHMLRSGADGDKVFKPCTVQREKGPFVLFPALTCLRYYMPFRSPATTVEYIKNDRKEIR